MNEFEQIEQPTQGGMPVESGFSSRYPGMESIIHPWKHPLRRTFMGMTMWGLGAQSITKGMVSGLGFKFPGFFGWLGGRELGKMAKGAMSFVGKVGPVSEFLNAYKTTEWFKTAKSGGEILDKVLFGYGAKERGIGSFSMFNKGELSSAAEKWFRSPGAKSRMPMSQKYIDKIVNDADRIALAEIKRYKHIYSRKEAERITESVISKFTPGKGRGLSHAAFAEIRKTAGSRVSTQLAMQGAGRVLGAFSIATTGFFAASLLGDLAQAATSTVFRTTAALSRSVPALEFGGTFQGSTTGQARTERQMSLAAIQRTRADAMRTIGNEAAIMHYSYA